MRLRFIKLYLILARRTDAPEGDFGFRNKISVSRSGFQARTMPDDAVYVFDPPAGSTDQVMMVVADSRFVERGGVRGFDAPHQSRFKQGMKIVINRLPGKAAEAFASNDGDGICVEMSAAIDRRQNCEPWRSGSHSRRP